MIPIRLTVNGREIVEMVEPRTHLADLLREKLNLTGTHLRCEQGACGTCTLLIDGQPARSCITYAALCDGATVTTIEGLDNDPVVVHLRKCFSQEHGLQCGFCTPGMLATARDIVLRLPDADEARVRLELSGNLCRCTGYVGIVRAICRTLQERRDAGVETEALMQADLGPVGARAAGKPAHAVLGPRAATPSATTAISRQGELGLGGREPTICIRQSFTVARPPDAVWAYFGRTEDVVHCLPGAGLSSPPEGEFVAGTFAVKLGPITANFAGNARIVRNDAKREGVLLGAGRDRGGGSAAAGEIAYVIAPIDNGARTRVDLEVRGLLTGPLAQFGRSGIVEDLARRVTEDFARNLDRRLSGSDPMSDAPRAPLAAGSLLWSVLVARLKSLLGRLFGRSIS